MSTNPTSIESESHSIPATTSSHLPAPSTSRRTSTPRLKLSIRQERINKGQREARKAKKDRRYAKNMNDQLSLIGHLDINESGAGGSGGFDEQEAEKQAVLSRAASKERKADSIKAFIAKKQAEKEGRQD